ncbi:MAG: WecB/TagA/CpsF family glycosyltransferase [Bacteroidetes bacterium]|nr:WecB/TagA/CpsF family glycosyltransferase [Bacteroidota bacterium]
MSQLFGYKVYNKTKQELLSEIEQRIKSDQLTTIISLNTLKLHQGAKDEKLKALYTSGTHVIPDGQSIVFAERLVHKNKIEAISGAELMVELIKKANSLGHRLFFLGSSQSLLDKVKSKIENDFPGLSKNVDFQNGYYDIVREEKKVIEKISNFKPDILFVAFGSPRKEEFIIQNKHLLNAKVLMGVGGSYEYFVGEVKLDSFTKKLGLRWLVRTLQDPRRLAKRYMICNSYFVYALIKEIFKK